MREDNSSIPQEQFNIPLVFANNIVIGRTLTELQITFSMNGRPATLIVIPFPVGKALIESLSKAIQDQETKTGQEILDLQTLFDKENTK